MKKLIFAILFCLFSIASIEANAQTSKELNVTKADTSRLYIRTAKSPNIPFAGAGYSIKIDSLGKLLFNKLSATNSINKLFIQSGGMNTTTLVSGTKTVTTNKVTANSKIVVFLITPSGTLAQNYAAPTANITAGTSFVINAYQSNATVQTGDNSVVGYIIIN